MSKRKKNPPGLYLRGGIWWMTLHGMRRTTGLREAEVAAAQEIRNKWARDYARGRAGIAPEVVLPRLTLAALIESYLKAESNPYDREKGGEQAGTKRSCDDDRESRDLVLLHLDGKMLASAVGKEHIIKLAEAIARDPKNPRKRATRRKHLSFLRRVFNWATDRPTLSGIEDTPFDRLTRAQRKDFFPKSRKRAYIFSPEQVRKLYELAKWRRPLVQFALHTAMRWSEITTLRRDCVNLQKRFAFVRDGYAKNGEARRVPLGDVALGILEELCEGLGPKDPVFRNPKGKEIKSIRTWFLGVLEEIWTPETPSEEPPRPAHDFRKTCATRVEAVSSHAVAKFLLGHKDEDVTDGYIVVLEGEAREALNRAARLIDGTQVGNVVVAEFSGQGTHKTSTVTSETA